MFYTKNEKAKVRIGFNEIYDELDELQDDVMRLTKGTLDALVLVGKDMTEVMLRLDKLCGKTCKVSKPKQIKTKSKKNK